MRSSLLEVMGEEFVQTARAKGVRDKDVRRRHAVPNALLPTFTLAFYSVGFILGGAVIIEEVFSWPGLGQLTYARDRGQRLPGDPGGVPPLERGGDPLQPPRGRPVRVSRSEGQRGMSTIETPSPPSEVPVGTAAAPPPETRDPRKIRRVRRKRALLGLWRVYRQSRMGMVGLAAPDRVRRSSRSPHRCSSARKTSQVANAPGEPFQPPSLDFPLGTDDFGRSVLDLVIYGSRISLLVGFAATVMTMTVGAAVGISGGYFGGKTDTVMNALTNWFLVIPWIPLAIVLASVLGAIVVQHDPRDRRDVVGWDRATGASRHPVGQGATVRGTRARLGFRQLAPGDADTSSRT